MTRFVIMILVSITLKTDFSFSRSYAASSIDYLLCIIFSKMSPALEHKLSEIYLPFPNGKMNNYSTVII